MPTLPEGVIRIRSVLLVTRRKGILLVVPSLEEEVALLFPVRFQLWASACCRLLNIRTATAATASIDLVFIRKDLLLRKVFTLPALLYEFSALSLLVYGH